MTYFTHWGPGAPGYNQHFHLNQSMGRSSTAMPDFANIVPRKNYDHLKIIRKQYQKEIYSSDSIQEVVSNDKSGYDPEDAEDEQIINKRRNSYTQLMKKRMEFTTSNEYAKCARFAQPRFPSAMGYSTLYSLRVLAMGFLMAILISAIVTNDFLFLFYYESYWGLIFGLVGILSSIKACNSPEWQKAAVVTMELALAFNIGITMLFWFVFSYSIFDRLTWEGEDLFLRFYLSLLHSVPLLCTVMNIAFTDIVLIKKDWKLVFVVALTYILANGVGSLALGHGLYPVVNWVSPFSTILIFVCQATVLSGMHVGFSHFSSKFKQY